MNEIIVIIDQPETIDVQVEIAPANQSSEPFPDLLTFYQLSKL